MNYDKELYDLETQLLQQMSIQESVAQWLQLQVAFEPQLQETEHLFAADRRQALIELQQRLRRLNSL